MDLKANQILKRIAVESLEKCVAKLSRISAGKWSVQDARVSCHSLEEAVLDQSSGPSGPGTAVYFEVRGEHPFTSMVVFRPEDIEIISRGFLGFSFSKLPNLSQAQELLLSELGNIILNSLIGSFSNALKHSFLPSAPWCVNGEPQFLVETLWMAMDRKQRHSMITVALFLQCGKDVTRSEVIALIPDSMEAALTGVIDAAE